MIKRKSRAKKCPGAGADDEKEAFKGTLQMYPFLRWLESYVQPQKTMQLVPYSRDHKSEAKCACVCCFSYTYITSVNILMLMFMLMSQV